MAEGFIRDVDGGRLLEEEREVGGTRASMSISSGSLSESSSIRAWLDIM